jgi:hypothetical protein
VKLKPKAVNKPLPYFIVPELDKPGSSATVSIIAQDGIGVFAHVEVQGFTLSCAQGGALDNLSDSRMPLWWCGLHVWLDDLLKEHRVSIPSCFALCHCFAPDSRTDEQLRVLGKHGKDTRFIRFNEPISITDNFHASIIHLYTKLYHQTRMAKIFELAFLSEVTLLPSPVLWLVFRFPLTHTQPQEG